MTFLRNVLHDLVEKRLWPVAVALLIALVAVPIVLGGGGSDPDAGDDVALVPPTPAPAAPTTVAADKVVKLAEDATTDKVERKGKLIDPFVQHHQPKGGAEDDASAESSTTSTTATVQDAVDTATSVVSSLGSLGSPGGSSSSGGTSAPATTPAATKPKATSDADDKDLYRVSLKFGEDGAMKTYKDIRRLTPLPSADDPFFVFLGVSEDKKSAVFLVSSDAEPTGDGTCRPSNDECSQVVMQEKDLEFFELQTATAGLVQYQLEVTAITKGKAKTSATAAKIRARESAAGRDYLREVMADTPERLDGWSFSKASGLLDYAGAAREDVAHVPAAVARAASGESADEPATVLTVPVTPEG